MPTIKQHGFIKDGKLNLLNRKRFTEDLRSFKDCDVEVIVKKKGKRSTQANDYYWGVVIEEIRIRLRELGNNVEADTVHEYLKGRFNKTNVITPNGELLEIPGSTTEMNKEEFGIYLESIIQFAAESLDIAIQPPNTQTQLNF